jgi:hypothetical protein
MGFCYVRVNSKPQDTTHHLMGVICRSVGWNASPSACCRPVTQGLFGSGARRGQGQARGSTRDKQRASNKRDGKFSRPKSRSNFSNIFFTRGQGVDGVSTGDHWFVSQLHEITLKWADHCCYKCIMYEVVVPEPSPSHRTPLTGFHSGKCGPSRSWRHASHAMAVIAIDHPHATPSTSMVQWQWRMNISTLESTCSWLIIR